ncbi:MAG: sigma 54-interacting transcriptional regulator [Bdellovibrionaceae bacterium]|nr:sigma 54-interacting transcriptional regulator [Pseudobdellovibrionaceae bacterium]
MNWTNVDSTHVIAKLKGLLKSWWNIEVLLVDNNGVLHDTKVDSMLGHLKPILTHKTFLKKIESVNLIAIKELKHLNKDYIYKEAHHMGLESLHIPIKFNKEVLGSVVAVGFKHQASEVSNTLQYLSLNDKQLSQLSAGLRNIADLENNHLVDILNSIAEEIQLVYAELSSKEKILSEITKEDSVFRYGNMIGSSKKMKELYEVLEKIKSANSSILIQGENGTGKELIAHCIHQSSQRKNKAFVIQNCSALNDNLLESELFGHVKGSFTGAHADKKGLFEVANNGTFFLDEIGDTSPSMQVKLLRVLQDGTFLPVGGTETRTTNVRIIAATNKNLEKMVEEGTFREDLYYRLNVISLRAPALRDRSSDIPILVTYFLNQQMKKSKKNILMSKVAIDKLQHYSWPGNVRELQNEIERAVVLCSSIGKINESDLSLKITHHTNDTILENKNINALSHFSGKLKDALASLEKQILQEGLRKTGGNKSRLSKELGISRANLIMKVEKYGLEVKKKAV